MPGRLNHWWLALCVMGVLAVSGGTARGDVTMTDPGTVTSDVAVTPDGGETLQRDKLAAVDPTAEDIAAMDAAEAAYEASLAPTERPNPTFPTRCNIFTTKRWRDGVLFGGRLWTLVQNKHFCYNGSVVGQIYTNHDGTQGSLTWRNMGLFDADSWGAGGTNHQGSYVKWWFQSKIETPGIKIGENNKPWISQTVYADGHATSNSACGC